MMSLSSSQAGIVAARRNKINQTKFNLYRNVIVEYDDQYYFQNTPPGTKGSFTARHIYNYNKNNNTFTLLGVQKAQSLIRKDPYQNITIDNTTLNNINNNRLYTNINPDLSRLQLSPDINFDINTADIFDTKNLANNQKVFIDIRWVRFIDGKRKGYTQGLQEAFYMNNIKGKMYRAGILIKDNTIDSMLYYTELIANSQIIKSMQQRKSFTSINI